jgi:hypothetical protein
VDRHDAAFAPLGNFIDSSATLAGGETITPAPLTVTGITANDKRYDGTTTATLNTSGAMIVGVVNGDTVTLDTSAATATFASAGIGNNIPVTVSGLALKGVQAGNYTLVQPALTANILPALPKAVVNSLNSLEGTSGLTPFVFQIRLASAARSQLTYDVSTPPTEPPRPASTMSASRPATVPTAAR